MEIQRPLSVRYFGNRKPIGYSLIGYIFHSRSTYRRAAWTTQVIEKRCGIQLPFRFEGRFRDLDDKGSHLQDVGVYQYQGQQFA